jgi:hypothetical protein
MIIVYIDPKDTNPRHDQNTLIDILTKANVEFTTASIYKTPLIIIRTLTQKMRENREKLSIVKGPSDKWNHDTLILPPVMEVNGDAYPWWYTRERLDEIIRHARIKIPEKKKLKIKRITNRKTTKDQIEIDLVSLARINITMLAFVSGIDPIDVMKFWPMGERTGFMLGWRLAQHYKCNDMLILADMLVNKAHVADPYTRDKHRWIGDEM